MSLGTKMMRRARSDGQETRQRLLTAACEIFAEKGFGEATTAEICRRAGANTAAVNYHFGGKEALYAQAWRYAFESSLRRHPPAGGVPPDAPPEERLRGRVLSIMRRISDPASHEFDIVHKEMANPTGLLADALRDSLEPLREALSSIVRELLGPKATEQQVKLCRMSMMAQCFGPMLRQRRNESFCPSHPSGGDPLFKDVALLTDHVVSFSLAGIREMARQVKAGQVEARADPKGDRE